MSKSSVVHTSEILVKVGLDNEKVPVHIEWEADEGQTKAVRHDGKAMMLSFFEKDTRETMKIDLWTKEMQVIEMDRFIYQTLRAMADTYYRATQNQKLATEMQRFVQYFGEETEVIPKAK